MPQNRTDVIRMLIDANPSVLRVKLAPIARAAGVSETTVKRALDPEDSRVSDATRAKIYAAAGLDVGMVAL